jgi:hypothetical protein
LILLLGCKNLCPAEGLIVGRTRTGNPSEVIVITAYVWSGPGCLQNLSLVT